MEEDAGGGGGQVGVAAGLAARGWRVVLPTMADGGVGHQGVRSGLVQGRGDEGACHQISSRGEERGVARPVDLYVVGREGAGMGGEGVGWISPHLEERREERGFGPA